MTLEYYSAQETDGFREQILKNGTVYMERYTSPDCCYVMETSEHFGYQKTYTKRDKGYIIAASQFDGIMLVILD